MDNSLVRASSSYLLYQNLRIWSDSEGRFYADPTLIISYLFPHNRRTSSDMIEVTPDMVISGLLALERMRYIRFYQIDDDDYLIVLKHPTNCKASGAPELPAPPSKYTQDRYIPTFAGHTDELPFDGEPDDTDEPPDPSESPFDPPSPPAQANDNECCLAGNARRYGLTDAQFERVIVPYCEARRSPALAWCFGPDACDDSIMAVIKRIHKQKSTIKDYPNYLMKALQEDLIENADTIRPPGAVHSTGPGGDR